MDRRRPLFNVRVEQTKVETISSLGAAIKSVRYEEGADKPDSVSIEVINANPIFLSDPKAAEGIIISLEMGYENEMEDFGNFKLKRPKYDFPATGHIAWTFQGEREEEAKLSISQERRQFKGKTDAEIAGIIAKEQGFKTKTKDPATGKQVSTIAATPGKPRTITITNKTWMEFLMSRAKKYGYQVWVDGDILHFEPIKDVPILNKAGKTQYLKWISGERGSLRSFAIKDDSSGKAAKVKATGIDPSSGSSFEQEGDPLPKTGGAAGDSVAKVKPPRKTVRPVFGGQATATVKPCKFVREVYSEQTTEQNKASILTKEETATEQVMRQSRMMCTMKGPVLFVKNEAESENDITAKQISEAKAQASAWSIEATAVPVIGLSWIRKNRTILLEGIGRFTGKWLITASSHSIDAQQYSTSFEVKTYRSKRPQAQRNRTFRKKEKIKDKKGKVKTKVTKSKDVAEPGEIKGYFWIDTNKLIESF